LTRVWVGRDAADPEPEEFGVEGARAYRDRLVLKLVGLDTPGEVETRRGRWILAPPDEVPDLPAGTYYVERLRGLHVEDARRGPLGRVADVLETGGADLLVVEGEGGRELLIPFAGTIVLEVREDLGTIRVDLPEGLAEDEA
jgi:16S rRNA processing protein RimM